MCLVDGAGVTEIVEDPEVAANVEITGSTAAEVAKIAGACPIVGIAEAVVVTIAAALLLLMLPALPYVVVAVAILLSMRKFLLLKLILSYWLLLLSLLLVNNNQSVPQTVYESRSI